jgi:hypothetical protein
VSPCDLHDPRAIHIARFCLFGAVLSSCDPRSCPSHARHRCWRLSGLLGMAVDPPRIAGWPLSHGRLHNLILTRITAVFWSHPHQLHHAFPIASLLLFCSMWLESHDPRADQARPVILGLAVQDRPAGILSLFRGPFKSTPVTGGGRPPRFERP